MKKQRDSGMELLRIFAILLVLGVHLFSYAGFYEAAKDAGGHAHSTALLMKLATRSAVNIFILITGYFMADRPFRLKKSAARTFDLYKKMLFYSVVLTLVFLPFGKAALISQGEQLTVFQAVFKGLLPVSSQTWYFLTDYLLLCLLIPFINLALQMLTKREYRILLVILILLMSVWATLLYIKPFSLIFEPFGYERALRGKNLFHFIFIYILGGYLCFYHPPRKKPNFLFLGAAAACVLLNYLLLTRLPASLGYAKVSLQYSNPLVIANAVFLLLFFKDLHFRSRIVNALASTTLGVYAITEFRFLRTKLWTWISFRNVDCSHPVKNIVMVASAILAIFLVCAGIDLLREKLFVFAGRFWNGQKEKRKNLKKT